jgi:Cdc6-like AAA superfamily ATPase
MPALHPRVQWRERSSWRDAPPCAYGDALTWETMHGPRRPASATAKASACDERSADVGAHDESAARRARTLITEHLTGPVLGEGLSFTPGLEAVCEKLVEFLVAALAPDSEQRRRAVKSLLIAGPQGSGKSSVVETALARYRKRTPRARPAIFYLDGEIFADGDLSAYRSFVAQLRRELRLYDGRFPSRFAGWESPLPETSSMPDEEVPANDVPHQASACIEAIVEHVQTLLRWTLESAERSMSDAGVHRIAGIVLVLDNIDYFARRMQHVRQHLLYSLFNMLGFDDASPFVIIGLTRRYDAMDLFEKRVRSRFSQTVLHVPLPESSDAVRTHLASKLEAFSKAEVVSICPRLAASARALQQVLLEDQRLARSIADLFRHCRVMRLYQGALSHALVALTYAAMMNTCQATACLEQHLVSHVANRDIRQRLLGLTSAELALLVAHSRAAQLNENRFASFQQAFAEYQRFVGKSAMLTTHHSQRATGLVACKTLSQVEVNGQRIGGIFQSEAVALRIFEQLLDLELLVVPDGARYACPSKLQMPLVPTFPEVVLVDVVQEHPHASTSLRIWCKSWLE